MSHEIVRQGDQLFFVATLNPIIENQSKKLNRKLAIEKRDISFDTTGKQMGGMDSYACRTSNAVGLCSNKYANCLFLSLRGKLKNTKSS